MFKKIRKKKIKVNIKNLKKKKLLENN